MARRPSRLKKVSYVLQVTCDKTHEMNEGEFLNQVREALQLQGIRLADGRVTVSVTKRIEEYINPAKEQAK